MSHVAEVTLQVTDLDALDAACKRIGLELVRGQKNYKWYGRWLNDWSDSERAAALKGRDPNTFGHCEHAVRIPGDPNAYEIGLCPRLDGKPGFDLVYDQYGHGGAALHKVGGKDLSELKDQYAASVTQRHLSRQGYRTRLQRTPGGHLQVVGQKA